MIKKILCALIMLTLLVSFTACRECIDTRQETVEVTIVDEYYHGPYTTFVYSGKVMIPIDHPATYSITVEYDGVEYNIGGSDVYNTYNDRIGETIEALLEIRTYDDGTVKYDILSLNG